MGPKTMKIWKYSEESMLKAIADVCCGVPIATAAKRHNVPRVTLMYKVKGKSPVHRKKGPSSILTSEEEKIICDWILATADAGFPVGKQHVIDSVEHLTKELNKNHLFPNGRPGRTWFNAFLRRNPSITTRVAQNLTITRAAVSEDTIKGWFQAVEDYSRNKGIFEILQDSWRLFNADETAFFLNPKGNKILARKGDKNVYQQVNPDEKECLTVLFTGNADGQLAPPFVVFKYMRIPQGIANSVPKDWGLGKSESGWMNGALFYEFITNVFHPWLVKEKFKLPVLLFIDGHTSHLTLHTSRFCEENGIILIALLPNATHILQPMDVGVFRSLKRNWKAKVHEWRLGNFENPILKKRDFPSLLKQVVDEHYSPVILRNAFRKCGLVPWDPSAPFQVQSNFTPTANTTYDKKNIVIGLQVLEKYIGPETLAVFKTLSGWGDKLEDKSLFEVWDNMKRALMDTDHEDAKINENVPMHEEFRMNKVNHEEITQESSKEDHAVLCTLEAGPSTSSAYAFSNSQNEGSLIPSPFKRVLFWPEPIKNKKKKCCREIIPSVVTSKEWQEYHSRKESKKKEMEEKKKERALARLKKKEEKQEEIRKKAKEKVAKKTQKRSKRNKKIEISSLEDDGEWVPSGDNLSDESLNLNSEEEAFDIC